MPEREKSRKGNIPHMPTQGILSRVTRRLSRRGPMMYDAAGPGSLAPLPGRRVITQGLAIMKPRSVTSMTVLFLTVLAPLATAPGQTVDRIDPPSWWAESQEQTLTLLLEGSGLTGAQVRVARGPIRVVRVGPGREGRALFVALTIPAGAEVGRCELEIAAGEQTIRRGWDLVAKPTRRPEPFGPDDVIYLIMIDRFANGDATNDEPPGSDRLLNRRDTHAYHGGDFAGIRRRLRYFADLGVTSIWLTPVYRQASNWFAATIGGKDRNIADFHGYCSVDFYDTNPRFGSLSEFRGLVDEAHRLGMKVIQDHVLGHTGPKHRWSHQQPDNDWFHGPLDHPPVCNFRFDALTNPHAREAERRGLTDGWFAGILPDLNMRNPRVNRYAIQQSLWWVTLFGADGVRLDTYPMVDRAFWRDWSRRLRATHPEIRVVGEAWVNDAADLSFFQGGRPGWDGIDPGVDTVFDFPLNQATVAVFSGHAPASTLAQALGRDGLYPRPDLLVTFLDNHDTPRFASLPGMTAERLRLAVIFLLTTRGVPQITWGDEIGLPGHMDDRRDFPGGFPEDTRDAFTTAGRTAQEQTLFTTYRDLLQLRKNSPALRRGTLRDLVANESVYAYSRQDETERVIIVLNLAKGPAEISLPPEAAGTVERLYGDARWVDTTIGPQIALPGESVAVFRRTTFPGRRSP
jgi:glycosidase